MLCYVLLLCAAAFSSFKVLIFAGVQGGSITKGLPGTRIHPESAVSYRSGSITQVSSDQPAMGLLSKTIDHEEI